MRLVAREEAKQKNICLIQNEKMLFHSIIVLITFIKIINIQLALFHKRDTQWYLLESKRYKKPINIRLSIRRKISKTARFLKTLKVIMHISHDSHTWKSDYKLKIRK